MELCRLRIVDREFEVVNLRFGAADDELQIGDCKVYTAYCKLKTGNCRLVAEDDEF